VREEKRGPFPRAAVSCVEKPPVSGQYPHSYRRLVQVRIVPMSHFRTSTLEVATRPDFNGH